MPSLAVISYGGDLSLSHGVLVQAHVMVIDGRSVITKAKLIYAYTPKSTIACSVKSDPVNIFRISEELWKALSTQPKAVLTLDYDSRSVYWSGQKILAVKIALLIGNLIGQVSARGFTALTASPEKVRALFGIRKGNAPKEEVITQASKQIGNFSQFYNQILDEAGPLRKLVEDSGDAADALILAVLGGRTILDLQDQVSQQEKTK